MAKSDTVHKCEVMDFFAYESEKDTNVKNTQIYYLYIQASDITLHFCFPDVATKSRTRVFPKVKPPLWLAVKFA